MHKSCIIGIGSPLRGDDALGFLAIKQLTQDNIAADCFTETGDVSHILDYFQNYNTVYIIDSIKNNKTTPGSIIYAPINKVSLQAESFPTSSHAVNILQCIEIAKNLNIMPNKIIICGIVGEKFDFGEKLSDSVSNSLPQLLSKITTEIGSIRDL